MINDLRSLAQLGEAVQELERGRQVRADRAAGVIELVEVSPGVYAAPTARRRANPQRKLPPHVRQAVHELGELGEAWEEVKRAWNR